MQEEFFLKSDYNGGSDYFHGRYYCYNHEQNRNTKKNRQTMLTTLLIFMSEHMRLLHKLKNDVTESYDITITPLCNSPSDMYILIGISVKTSADRQIIHQVASFCQLAVLRFLDIQK